jgi:hypothetical protein
MCLAGATNTVHAAHIADPGLLPAAPCQQRRPSLRLNLDLIFHPNNCTTIYRRHSAAADDDEIMFQAVPVIDLSAAANRCKHNHRLRGVYIGSYLIPMFFIPHAEECMGAFEDDTKQRSH